MSVRQVSAEESTKDGRRWIYEVRYDDKFREKRVEKSKKFMFKREAVEAEAEFRSNLDKMSDGVDKDMSFGELATLYYDYRSKEGAKTSTLGNYKDLDRHLTRLYNVKLDNLNVHHINAWKDEMRELDIGNSYRNTIMKLLKAILNYGTKIHGFDFNQVYNKITNFIDPDEVKKDIQFFDYNEFKQYISVEEDMRWRCLFETLYYCGCRKGEARALTWNSVDWGNYTISINKNVTEAEKGAEKAYKITSPKTKSSVRIIPMPKALVDDLKLLYEQMKEYEGFNDSWYCFGFIDPVSDSTIFDRHVMNTELSGVKRIRIHDFRHSCSSLLISKGADATIVAKYLGHAKIEETLNTYTHLFGSRLKEIVNILDDLEQ